MWMMYVSFPRLQNDNLFGIFMMKRESAPVVELHIRIMSYDFDTVRYKTCRSVDQVCKYIIKEYIPVEFRAVPPGEKLKFLRERRQKRVMAAKATRYGHLSGEEGYEFDGEKEFEFRKKMNETALSDTKKNVKPG